MSSSDEEGSEQLIDWGLERRGVPKYVMVSIMLVEMLHGFVHYLTLWSIQPFVQWHMNASEATATLLTNTFLGVNYLAPLFGGILSDVCWTRYSVAFGANCVFVLAYALGIVFHIFIVTNVSVGWKYAMYVCIILVLGASRGISKVSMIPFGVEQLADDRNMVVRGSFIRWLIFCYEIGRVCSTLTYIIQFKQGNPALHIIHYICLSVGVAGIPLFVVWKRYYHQNELEGSQTFRHMNCVLKRKYGCSNDDDDDDDESIFAGLSEPTAAANTEVLHQWQHTLLRRFLLLNAVFVMFGPYEAAYFLTNTAFVIQAKEQMPDAKHIPFFNQRFYTDGPLQMGSLTILLVIPILDFIIRKRPNGCLASASTFMNVGLGLFFASLSMAAAFGVNYAGQHGHTLANQFVILFMIPQCILGGLSEIFFFCGGYEMAYVESPPHCRGTTTGMFLSIGSIFGLVIYVVFYVIYVSTEETKIVLWRPYLAVSVILALFIVIGYIPLVRFYRKAKRKYQECRAAMMVGRDRDMVYMSIAN